MGDKLVKITNDNFKKEVLENKGPVLVDFWAEWCGPCRMVDPVLDEVVEEYSQKIKVVKLNVDENSAIAEQYEVRSIPTLIVFENGEAKQRLVGAMPKKKLVDELGQWLK